MGMVKFEVVAYFVCKGVIVGKEIIVGNGN